jgi:Putative Na+/H+ antiporter
VPASVVLVHLVMLALVVLFAHHPAVFLGLFLFFLGYASAYERHQSPLILREALLVAFFLAGLVVLGGLQRWWLEPVLMSMDANAVFFGATALTAITDNAALTYLGSLVEGLSDEFKVALVAGAVTGGGLTWWPCWRSGCCEIGGGPQEWPQKERARNASEPLCVVVEHGTEPASVLRSRY